MDPQLVQSLVKSIERKDLSTAAHTWRVVLYTRTVAEEYGVDHDAIARLTTAAALHDVGKLDVSHTILQKQGPLTEVEYASVKLHAAHGHARLRRMGVTDPVILDLVRHHHERWDGLGYPDAIAGEHISIPARFFSIIDSFDAMTSFRPYRRDVGRAAADRAIIELENGRGTRYWPEAVDAFAGIYRAGKFNWILHYFNDDVPTPEFRAEQTNRPKPSE